ncbi:hypothetical protein BT93_H0857 [Corymbia citriodora subsp. variegata]|nr:hypothetical protein BT93_H0857 [Corymbia citriodora subsp. variegata]
MSIDPAIAIAWDVLKWVVVPIKRQFGYIMSSKRYARDLQKEVGKLAYEAERVHNAVEVARNNLRNVYNQVMEWQACAEKALKDGQDLLGVIEQASKSCCYGTIPDPSCRYQFSRKAKDKIEVIRQLAREVSEFKDISFSDPAPGNVVAPTLAGEAAKDVVQLTTATASTSSASMLIELKDDGVFESRASIIRNIMDALADNYCSVVGVHGMGGVGKSTLLVDAERRIREEKSFDLVAKADVSENPDIKRIQEEIAYALGISDVKNEEYISLRANLLHRRLEDEERKKKKVLIILDNLWEGLDLKSVGIPCRNDNKVLECKLLLTSRDRDVLRREMGCDRDFLLGGLKEEEARRLFERMVGDKFHDDEFKPLVDEALQKCAGLPFLILAMAKRFKDADVSEWNDTLKQIEMCKNEGISEVINKMLQLSYDHLKGEEVKSLLRLCAVYGVSRPSLNNLVRYAIGVGLFGEYNRMEDARNRLSSLIRTLQASSLLLDNGDIDSFKIHDLVRQFVSSVASRDYPLLVLKDKHKSVIKLSKDKLKSCKAICFPYVDMKELPEELDCPELHIFLLFTNNKSINVPDSYFHSMRKVMVINLTGIRLSLSPSLFQSLENLHTLCLDGCLLEDVAIIGELKGLEILSFVNSKVQLLPKEIGQLVKLRLLDLNCSLLEIIEPDVLGSLIKLEELYMENSFHQWNSAKQTPPTNASLIELNNMADLCTLHISIPDPSVLPEDLNLEKLTKYRIQIGNAWRWPSENKGSRTLELKLNPVSEVLQKGCIQSILGKTDNLFLDGLNGIEHSICRLSPKCFPKLKHLHVQNSSSVHYILGWSCIPAFKTLESLLLHNLINLEKICHNHISSKSFSTLKVVRVINCDKMEVLFPLSSMSELPQLEEISVSECYLMREIVEADKCGKIELRNLHELKLRDLPNIKNFSITRIAPLSSTSDGQVGTQVAFFNGQQVAFPSLEKLDISGMDNIEMIWDNQVIEDSFHNLKSLSVHECSKLKCVWDKKLHCQDKFQCLRSVSISRCESLTSLFPTSVARDLIQLEELKIHKSGIVNLIEKEGLDELTINVEVVQGPSQKLKVILPISKYFGHLKTLDVSHCDGLSNMFPPTIAKNLVELTKLRINNCKMLTEVISDEEGKEEHIVAFNQLTYIELEGLTGLRCFSSAKSTLIFPLLKDVIVTGCFNMEFFSEGPIEAPKLERVQATVAKVNFMRLSEFPGLIGKWHTELIPIMSSWHLESLVVDKCSSFINAIPSKLMLFLDYMDSLQVHDCESLEVVFDLEGLEAVESTWVLPQLQYLHLVNLPKLRRLWNKDLQGTLLFGSLSALTLYNCCNLRHAFVPSMVQCLANLTSMEIKECGQMEGVIAERVGEGSGVDKITFPILWVIRLECLPNLTNFLLGMNHVLDCPGLYELSIAHCPKMRSLTWQSSMEIDQDTQSFFTPQSTAIEMKESINPSLSVSLRRSRIGIICENCEILEKSSFKVVQFPWLNSMVLSHMENLTKIWIDNSQETLACKRLGKVVVQNCKSLKNLFPHWVASSLSQLEKLRVEFCVIEEIVSSGDDALLSTTAQVLFPKLTSLVLHDMPRLKSFWPNLHTLNWPFLKKVRVTHCEKLNKWTQRDDQQNLLDQEAHSSFEREFPNLERLLLVNKDIQMIQDGKFPHDIFGQIEALTLACFHDEKAVFPARFILERFQNLQSLEVFCSSFEDIFPNEGLVDGGKPSVLENLRKLKLSYLHNLKRVWRQDYLVSKMLQSIKSFKVWDCPDLTTLFPTMTSFKNLTELVVKNSSGLSHLVTVSAITNLVHLTYMSIVGCERMKEVVANDGDEEGKVISLRKLETLGLQHLPSLVCFSSTNCIFRFPSLNYIEVEDCPKMRIFSMGPVSTPKQLLATLFRYNYEVHSEGDLNAAIQKFSA